MMSVVVVVVRRLVEQAGARTGAIVGALSGGADVVDPGVPRQVAARLIAPRLLAAKSARIGEGLMAAAAAHHRTNAAEQQRSADHAGRGRSGSSQERATTAERRLPRAIRLAAIGLTIRRLIILSWRLRLLQ